MKKSTIEGHKRALQIAENLVARVAGDPGENVQYLLWMII